ncbi:MAG: hypothetical protein ACOC5L_04305 [Halobacteriota archaeon]
MRVLPTLGIILITLSLAGCSLFCDVCGKYVSPKNPDAFIELNADGTYDADLTGLGFGGISGEYKVKDDKVRLYFESTYIEFEREGDALVYGVEEIMEWRFVKE